MLQIRLLGQFDVRLDGKRVLISSRAGQSLLAYLALTAGTLHRREKLAGIFWPDISDEKARTYLRQELWRIRKAITAEELSPSEGYLLADEYTLTFNPHADYWVDVAVLEKTEFDVQSLASSLSLYQGELLPGFYEDWIVLERERLQTLFESKMEQLVEKLVDAERWTAVEEQCERWLALGHGPEPAYRALMLSYNARGDMAKVSSTYQRCVEDLRDHFGVEPSAETHALFNGLLKGAKVPRRIMPAQPSGTVTFLFTDIQGSTRLLDKLGEQYATSLAEHHRVLRAAIRKWKGTEMDTQGDAFFVTFTRALDAVQCAAEAQRMLANHDWPLDEPIRVRMGLHTGEPLIASTGYVGMDVHRAARIGDAGHGGQVLLSQTTRDLVMQDLPSGITIKELGEHRLKDMKYPTPIYQLVIEGLQTDYPPLKTKFTGSEAPVPGEPPFKGLQYFDELDSDLFFGRELLTAKLVNRLRDTQFLSVVIGASGSGKSSLVRAGLIPALKKGGTLLDGTKAPEGSADWQIHIITPTAHPLEALATELTRHLDSLAATGRLIDDLAQEPRSLALFFARAGSRHHTVLVVDQFEELFTLCRDEFEREAFIDNLLTTISSSPSKGDREVLRKEGRGEGHITIIITLRADFYAHLAQYPELRDAVAQQQEYIGPMTAEELRRAIEEPAKHGHWEFEPGLVDLILRDGGDEPGALPLLSHALLETWKRRAGHTLTLKGYADAGGVHGAIAHTAESIYHNLSPEDQKIAQDIFVRLTELGEGTEDTRRRVSFEELTSFSEDTGDVRAVLNKLAEARLITLGENTVEVAHEALIREWPTLREWLNQDREGLRLHRHLTEAAYEWELLGRDPGALYRGAHLVQAREWAALHPNALNAGERAFLNASVEQEQREEQEREEQRQRELAAAKELAETQRQSASRLRIRNRVITIVGSVALVLALLAGMFGVQSNRNAVQADSNFRRAEAQRLALEANRLLLSGGSSEQIALLSLRSMKTNYTTEGDAALAAAARLGYPHKLFTHTAIVWYVAFSPDGKYVLTGTDDKTAILWDVQSGQELRRFTGHTEGVVRVYFSPNGKNILTIGLDKSTIMWDAATGREVYRITTDPPLRSMAYSHDGKTIFTSSMDNTIRQWDVENGKEVGIFMTTPDLVTRISISPDDKYMVTFSNTAQLWNLETGQKLREFLLDATTILTTAFSPDSNFVLTGNTDGIAYLWDIRTGNEVRRFIGHTGPLYSVTFSPDNKSVLTGGGDNTMRLWDIETGQELRKFTFSDYVTAVAVSPDGQWVLTSGDDGTTRLWDLNASSPLPMFSHRAGVNAVAFSPDGELILTGGVDGTARLWEAETGENLRDFIGHTDVINYAAAFSPDGKYIVTASWDKTVRLWDPQTGDEVRQFVGHTESVNDLEFSPDGRYILTAGEDTVRLWHAKTGKELRQFGETGQYYGATFSPDGKYVLTAAPGYDDGKARLWDVSTGELIREYQSPIGGMSGVSFSADGEYMLTAGQDGIARLWNVETGKEVRQFVGHTDRIYNAIVSPDGKTIATASPDNTARLWDIQTGQELRRFTGHTAGVENVAFSPDGKYILTGSDDGTALLWDVDYHTTMEYLCSRLQRDFTEEERAQYGITDNEPTCTPKP
jgi:WD40 repeat protein/class 3 adenylate cyclase